MPKEIVISTETANNKGFVLQSQYVDFARFNKHPIMLKQHQWENEPLGTWAIRLDKGVLLGTPTFNLITEDSKLYSQLYEAGQLTASIGGFAIFRTIKNSYGELEPYKDENGNMFCEKFELYEVSLVTIPSNPDAVMLMNLSSPVIMEESKKPEIVLLSSKYNLLPPKKNAMEEQKPIIPTIEKEESISLSGFGKLVSALSTLLKGGEVKPAGEMPKVEPGSFETDPKGKPTGLAAKIEKAKKKMETASEKAEKAKKAFDEMKEKHSGMEMDEAAKKELEECEAAYNKASQEYDDCAKVYNAMIEDEDGDATEMKAQLSANRFPISNLPKVSLTPKPVEKSTLNTTPPNAGKVVGLNAHKTLTQLRASHDATDKAIVLKFTEGGTKEDNEYWAILNGIVTDPKFQPIAEKFRLHETGNINADTYRFLNASKITDKRGGKTIQNLYADAQANGFVKLNSSNDFLNNPSTDAIDFLSLAIFRLFPSTDWRSSIPMFSADFTDKNLGLIWANIAADPNIYFNTQPTNPANYSVDDNAVALTLNPFFIEPMLWNPYKTALKRYDQMGMQWDQAIKKLYATMDDYLIYQIQYQTPSASIIKSTGITNTLANPLTTNMVANDNNSWVWNPAFNGTVYNPVLNDIFGIEQLFRKQNFDLKSESVVLVIDPTALKMLKTDPNVQTILNRYVTKGGEQKFSDLDLNTTQVIERSRVGVYNPANGQIVDPTSSILSTYLSSMSAFISSQIGIGMGMFDVFMQQDPTNYGVKLSADIRIGVSLLRTNGNGSSIFTYGQVI
jgi:hypothetical protein